MPRPSHAADPNAKLFTSEELAVLPADVLGRQRLKQQAKKAKKRRAAMEKTEDELMFGFMGMAVEAPLAAKDDDIPRVIRKKVKKARKVIQLRQVIAMETDDESRKEAEFANFLSNMGGESLQLPCVIATHAFSG